MKSVLTGVFLIAGESMLLVDLAHGEADQLRPLLVIGQVDEDPVPGKRFVFSQEEIEESGADSVVNLLENRAGLPVLSFFGDPGLGSPVIRGFGENASSRTLILLDGIPLNRPDLGSAPWFQLPLSSMKKVEVMKGSRTVRYGSAALAGVISLETKAATEEFGGNLEVIRGSFDSQIHRGSILVPFRDWSMGLHLEHNESEGYREHSQHESRAWSAVVKSPESESFQGKWFFSGSRLNFENPGSLSEEMFRENPRQSRNLPREGEVDQFENANESFRVAQSLLWNWGKGQSLEVNSSWLRRERESNFGRMSHSDQTLETLTLESVWSGEKAGWSWQLGIRGQLDELENERFNELERVNSLGTGELDRRSIGLFVLGRYAFENHWALTAGAGWDRWSLEAKTFDATFPNDDQLNLDASRAGDGVAAEISLSYERDENWRAWLRYDRVYRFPVIDEIASYQGFVLTDPFNANLDSETGHSIELGWEYERDRWSLETTVFSQWLDDEIAFDFVENNNVNFADTHRFGIENRFQGDFESWEAHLNHSLTFARYRSGEFLGTSLRGKSIPLVPKHLLSARVRWKPSERLTVDFEAQYVDDSPEGNDFRNENSELPSRWLFNTQTRWAVDENLELFLKIDNLFDQQYATVKFLNRWYPGAGRKISFGGQWTF